MAFVLKFVPGKEAQTPPGNEFLCYFGSYVASFLLRCFQTAVNSPSIRPLKVRPRSVFKNAATKCAGTPGWTRGRSVTPASCTWTTTPAATVTARWGRASSAGEERGAGWSWAPDKGLHNSGLKAQGSRIIRGSGKCVFTPSALYSEKNVFWKATWHCITNPPSCILSAVAMP